MVKLVVHFMKPKDAGKFEDVYNDFLALVERMPLIQRRQVNSVLGSPLGETPLFRVLEVYFEDFARLNESLRSPAGQEAGGELRRLPAGSFDMIFAEVYEETGGKTEGK
ncbi:MAG: EthD family reductase [Anaerolineae bacterium]|nr:EthD family reductase [Anaerolineae bacterium]